MLMIAHFFTKYRKTIQETGIITIANFLVALLINLLAWKFKLVSGGLTGYSIYFNYLTGVPVGIFLLGLNVGLVLLALLFVGKGPGVRAIYGFVSLSFFFSLLLIIVLSMAMGVAVSVVLANNYSVGAYSTIFIIVSKYIHIPAQNLFFLLDFILAALTGITFGPSKGILLMVNAVVAYFMIRFALPRCQDNFSKFKD